MEQEFSKANFETENCTNAKLPPKEKKSKMSMNNKKAIGFVACMLLPAILHFCIFYIYINSQSFFLSVWDDNGPTLQYIRTFLQTVFKSGEEVALGLKNTLIFFVFGNFFMFPLSLVFSYFLYKKVPAYKYFRIVFFLPSIISATVMVTLYKYVVTGPFTQIYMETFEVVNPKFLNNSKTALLFVLIYQFWIGLGGNMIIYSGTMARIPEEVIESAKLDGIGFWQELIYMVIPLMWPTISTLILLSFVNIFGSSGPILLFKNWDYTMTISHWIFLLSTDVDNPQYNLAAAAGMVFTFVQLPIVFLVRYISKKLDSGVEY